MNTMVVLRWKCNGLAKYGRSGAERRAKLSAHYAEKCETCDWWHLIPRFVKLNG